MTVISISILSARGGEGQPAPLSPAESARCRPAATSLPARASSVRR